jgi:SAM-dependent methyltransferase
MGAGGVRRYRGPVARSDSRALSGCLSGCALTTISVMSDDATMNEGHAWCGSDDWKAIVREHIVPWALGDRDLGDDVLEVGPGYGATTEVFRERIRQLTAVEIDPALASALADRFKETNVIVVEADASSMTFPDGSFTGATCFAMLHHVSSTELQDRIFGEIARVLRPGGLLVASDAVYSDELAEFHKDDTYLPVDPSTLDGRLRRAGFVDIDIELGDFGWAARAWESDRSTATRHRSRAHSEQLHRAH